MTTVVETCDACGQHRQSTITLTVPLAVATEGAEDLTVTAIVAVQTVVPVPVNLTGSPSHGNDTAGLFPVAAGAMGFGTILGWGLTAWTIRCCLD